MRAPARGAWVEETTAVALHKGNVHWEMSGWALKHFPGNIKVDIRGRLQDKIIQMPVISG